MHKIPTFTALKDLDLQLGDWWAKEGEKFKVASEMATRPMGGGQDLSVISDLLGVHGEHLGWVSQWVPDMEDFLQQATALATESILAERPDISATVLKITLGGRIHHYTRLVRAVERLGATLVHRMEALRSMISTERERWKQEMSTPRQS